MVNTKDKGDKHEGEARDIYERAGFLVWKPGRGSRCVGPNRFISTPNDVFGVFDFLAWSDIENHNVQVTSTDSHSSEMRKAIEKLPCPEGTVRVVMQRIPGHKGWFKAWVLRDKTGGWIKSEVIQNDLFEIKGE